MRQTINPQMKLGEVDIGKISFDLSSRDDIPQILMGLQHIYVTLDVRNKVFDILETMISNDVSLNNGRPGMDLWKILVMGTLRVNLNLDYDRIHEEVNNHHTIRQMLGHGFFDFEEKYRLQTIKDNVSLLTADILMKINEVVVSSGHSLVKEDKEDKLHGRCDSFVVETNVPYPTDTKLLFEAIRKSIQLISVLCVSVNVKIWDEHKRDIKKIKNLYRKLQKLKKSTSKNNEKREQQIEKINDACLAYINLARHYLIKVLDSKMLLHDQFGVNESAFSEVMIFIGHAYRQIDQVERRIIKGEKIPHEEKVFSLFEPHTEWINKGKSGVPMELGLNVCILEDQYGFILHHKIMQEISDSEIAVDIIKETKNIFPEFSSCSFDKGFYSNSNKEELNNILDFCVIPKKGKLSKEEFDAENEETFKQFRRKHSAVESAINALEVHGLDKCYDHGINGFKRYVALAVVARNIQKIGSIIRNDLRNKKKAA